MVKGYLFIDVNYIVGSKINSHILVVLRNAIKKYLDRDLVPISSDPQPMRQIGMI